MSELDDLRKRVEVLEELMRQLRPPCVYEARRMPTYMQPTDVENGQWGSWCRTHGWYCPAMDTSRTP